MGYLRWFRYMVNECEWEHMNVWECMGIEYECVYERSLEYDSEWEHMKAYDSSWEYMRVHVYV